MQPLINFPDYKTTFSSSFFHPWRRRMLYAWAQQTPLKWTCASLWKAAILAERWSELGCFFYKGRRCTDEEHECVSFQGALTGKLNKSTSVFNTQQLWQETHTGTPLFGSDVHQTTTEWHEESCRSHDTLQWVWGRSWRFYEKVKFGQIIFIKR